MPESAAWGTRRHLIRRSRISEIRSCITHPHGFMHVRIGGAPYSLLPQPANSGPIFASMYGKGDGEVELEIGKKRFHQPEPDGIEM